MGIKEEGEDDDEEDDEDDDEEEGEEGEMLLARIGIEVLTSCIK